MQKQQYLNIFFIFVFFIFCSFQCHAVQHNQECGDIIVDNTIKTSSEISSKLSNCAQFYEIIKATLDKYTRPITVLILGAAQGYFAFRIAKDYTATCVMIESNHAASRDADTLLNLCHSNSSLQNIVFLNKRMSLSELQKLSDCEHFDVVIAIDYINPNATSWRQRIDAILSMGDKIFIQIHSHEILTKNGELDVVSKYLSDKHGKLVFPNTCTCNSDFQERIFFFECKKIGLRSKSFALPSSDLNMEAFRIESSYTSKVMFKKGSSVEIPWKRGINLITFLMLNGVYPTKEHIKKKIVELTKNKLTDFAPWNLIVQGSNIELIDQNDKGWHANVKRSLKLINEVIDFPYHHDFSNLFEQGRKKYIRKNKWSWLNHLV